MRIGDITALDQEKFLAAYRDISDAANRNGGLCREVLAVVCDMLANQIYANGKNGGQEVALKTRAALIQTIDVALMRLMTENKDAWPAKSAELST